MKSYLTMLVIPAVALSQSLNIHLPMQANLRYELQTETGSVVTQKGMVDIDGSSKLYLKINSALTLVDDGKSMWYYDIPLKQVSVYPHSKLWDTLFWDVKKIKQHYVFKKVQLAHSTRYTLLPKKNLDIKSIVIDVSKAHDLLSFSYVDGLDDKHSYSFTNVKHGKSKNNLFEFTVPKNIDVIRYDQSVSASTKSRKDV